MTGERTFSDQEVALILRRAMAMQQEPGTRGDGLSLTELRDIAREIGVDPELVSKVANQLPSSRDSVVDRLLGGNVRQELHLVHQGVLSREQLHDLTMAIRSAMEHQGRTEEVLDAVEWRTGGEFNDVAVTARSHGGSTSVHVMVDRSGMAVVTGFASVGLGVFVAAIVGSLIEPGVAGGIAILSGGVAGGALLLRGIWRWTARALETAGGTRVVLNHAGPAARGYRQPPGPREWGTPTSGPVSRGGRRSSARIDGPRAAVAPSARTSPRGRGRPCRPRSPSAGRGCARR